MDAIEGFRALYEDRGEHGDHPDRAATAPYLRQLHDAVLLIRGGSRLSMQEMMELLRAVPQIEQGGGGYPRDIVREVCNWGRSMFGAVLRGEPPPPKPASIQGFHDALQELRVQQDDLDRSARESAADENTNP